MKTKIRIIILRVLAILPLPSISMAAVSKLSELPINSNNFRNKNIDTIDSYSSEIYKLRSVLPPTFEEYSIEEARSYYHSLNLNLTEEEANISFYNLIEELEKQGLLKINDEEVISNATCAGGTFDR